MLTNQPPRFRASGPAVCQEAGGGGTTPPGSFRGASARASPNSVRALRATAAMGRRSTAHRKKAFLPSRVPQFTAQSDMPRGRRLSDVASQTIVAPSHSRDNAVAQQSEGTSGAHPEPRVLSRRVCRHRGETATREHRPRLEQRRAASVQDRHRVSVQGRSVPRLLTHTCAIRAVSALIRGQAVGLVARWRYQLSYI